MQRCVSTVYGCNVWMRFAGESPRREAFTITPAGYYFRKRTFRKLDALINEFKRHPQPPASAAEEDFTQQLAAVGSCGCSGCVSRRIGH
jgi:hypothetical protein